MPVLQSRARDTHPRKNRISVAMSTLGKILPLIITLIVLAIVAFVGFVIYSIVNDVADKTSKKMEQKNVIFTKDGMKVRVKELKGEDFVGSTQKSVSLSSKLGFTYCSKRERIF